MDQVLGLSASLLGGGTARSPKLLPGWAELIPKNLELGPYLHLEKVPFAASPALGAMQESIPD